MTKNGRAAVSAQNTANPTPRRQHRRRICRQTGPLFIYRDYILYCRMTTAPFFREFSIKRLFQIRYASIVRPPVNGLLETHFFT